MQSIFSVLAYSFVFSFLVVSFIERTRNAVVVVTVVVLLLWAAKADHLLEGMAMLVVIGPWVLFGSLLGLGIGHAMKQSSED